MAAFRQCIGRMTYDFAHRFNSHDLQNIQRNSLLQVSSLFIKYRQCHIENDGLRVVGNERMTARDSQDSYAMVALTLFFVYSNKCRTKRKVSKNEDCVLFTKDCSTENKIYWYRARRRSTFCTASSSHPRQSQIRAYSGYAPQSEPLFKTKTGYYDILDVGPSATQAQIKTAYYKQSFLYHPDRNAGSETSTSRFSDISEAYTVLGNKTLRKKYDRGLLTLSDLVRTGSAPGKEPAGSDAKSRTESRRSVMGEDDREKIYHFDAFFKFHYQEQLRREKELRLGRDKLLKKQTESFEEKNADWLVGMGMCCTVALASLLWFSMKSK